MSYAIHHIAFEVLLVAFEVLLVLVFQFPAAVAAGNLTHIDRSVLEFSKKL